MLSLDARSTFVAFESTRDYDDEDDMNMSELDRSSPGDEVPISGIADRSFDEIVEEALQRDDTEEEKLEKGSSKKHPFLRRGEGRSCLGSPSPSKTHQQEQYPSRDKENETKTTRQFSRNILRKKSMRKRKKKDIMLSKKIGSGVVERPVDEETEKFGALDEIVFGQGKQLLTFEYEKEEDQVLRRDSNEPEDEQLAEFEELERRLMGEENDMTSVSVKDLRSRLRDRAITTSQLFGFMDSDRSDRLTAKEIQNGLAYAGIHIDMSAVRSLMEEFDLDQDRSVSWSEFRDAFEDDVEDKDDEDKNEDEYTWGSLHHLSTNEHPEIDSEKEEEREKDLKREEMQDNTLPCKSSLVRSYFPEENVPATAAAHEQENVDESTNDSVPKVLQDRLQQQLTRLDSEIVQYERERRNAAERKERLKRAEDQLARDRAAFETWRKEQREMTGKWVSEQQDKIKRRKTVLDRQAKAMYNHVPDRKERKEIENLKATIAQLNLERKKSDSKWRLNVKRLESNVRSLEARVGELLDEMDCMNQERLEHLEERQKWEKIRDRKTGAARRVHNTDTEIRDKQMVEVVRQNTKPVVVVEKKPSSSSPPPQIDAKKKEEFVEKKFADGKIERRYSDGRVEMIFRNGTRKVMSTDPSFGGSVSCTIYFSNGDVKRTDPSGTVTYFYASANTTHTTRTDGVEIFEFPSGQKETHHVDGRKDILFEDGTRKTIYPNKEEHSLFPDGTKVVEFPDGTKRVTSPDGSNAVEGPSSS